MRRNANSHAIRELSDRKWTVPFFASLLLSVTLFLSWIFGLLSLPYAGDQLQFDIISFNKLEDSSVLFMESELEKEVDDNEHRSAELPGLAYLISGTKGDSQRMMRTLQAAYHPRNQYILHLDLEAPPRERLDLTHSVKSDPTFREVENVRVMVQSNLVTYKGPTMIASTLQAIAILLKESLWWDWFINLSASDYPLVTQDNLLYAFSNISRSLNLIKHSLIYGWKLALSVPRAFEKIGFFLRCLGLAWVFLSRFFLEYCIWGVDNLPRTILMHYANFESSPEGYFQTVICKAEQYRRTAISHDLHYIAWDNPPKQHPHYLSIQDFDRMLKSNAPFARKFAKDDPALDKINMELVGRTGLFAPGAWCTGSSEGGKDPCSMLGNDSAIRPWPGAERLQELLRNILSEEFQSKQCS